MIFYSKSSNSGSAKFKSSSKGGFSGARKSAYKYVSLNYFEKPVDYNIADGKRKDFEPACCYNYNGESGILKSATGFCVPSYPTKDGAETSRSVVMPYTGDIKKIWFYPYYETNNKRRVDKIIFYSTENQLWTFPLFYAGTTVVEMLEEIYGISISKLPIGLSYRIYNEDFMLFSTENGLITYSSQLLPGLYENCPEFISMVKIYDLLWAIPEGDRNKIIYNEDLNPRQWSNLDQIIDLSQFGRLNKLLSFDDYLFVFRDFGITKISKYGTGAKFSVSNIYDSGSKIIAETINVCGNSIIFFAEDGLYSFNGSTVKPIDLGFNSLLAGVKNKAACAAWCGGKFYLACKLNFNDGKEVGCEALETGFSNNALISFDPQNGYYSITRGIDICSLTSVLAGSYSEILAAFNGENAQEIGLLKENGSFFNTNLDSYYKSKTTDFGEPGKKKKIKEITIKSINNCRLTIGSDEMSKALEITGAMGFQTLKTNIKGKNFYFEIQSNGAAEIHPPQFKIEIFDK